MTPPKRCTRCGHTKDASEFSKNRSQRDGLASWCRPCHKDYRAGRWKTKERDEHLRKKYGIGSTKYDRMLAEQGGVCLICGEGCSSGKPLAVDHCHDTGVVRGLLCGRCNVGVGLFRDNPSLLVAAASYIESRR